MSLYLEIPELHSAFPFRTFINDGWEIVYPHWHKEIEVIYCLTGTVKLGAFGEIFELAEGEIFFFPSGEPHFFLASPDSKRIVFQFDLRFFMSKTISSPPIAPYSSFLMKRPITASSGPFWHKKI